MESADLAARARRAYEAGRLRWALQIGWMVIVLVGLSSVAASPSRVTILLGVALLATVTALRWRGQTFSLAARVGLLAGLIPFTLLLGMKCGSSMCCALGNCMAHCTLFCGLGGLAAGVLLASRARRLEAAGLPFLVAGSLVAALTGLLGCFVGGLTGAVWMLAGELAATLPAYASELKRISR
ncbi:MAG: hypothetical protein JWN44_3903 [Myxococcales bacterium]|nr:hypothetical protein [Myxococcales bacterium]